MSAVSTGRRPGGFSSRIERIHVAVLRQGQAARDRGGGHHQDIGALALFAEVHALADAEAVLLVDDGEAEVAEGDVLLEEGVGSDGDGDRAGGQRLELTGAFAALVAAGEDVEADAGGLGERCQREEMLAGEDLGRRHHRGLASGLDRGEHGEEGDQGLAGADVALQQAVHPVGRGHVGSDLGDGAGLRACGRIGERGEHAALQAAVAAGGEALGALHLRAGDGERHLVGEKLVVGEALAGGRRGDEVAGAAGGVGGEKGGVPVGPAALALDARLDPLGKLGGAGEAVLDGAGHGAEGQALGERVDRLEGGKRLLAAGAQDVVGVDHLGDAVEDLDPAGDDAALPGGELLADPVGARVEEDELELGQDVTNVDAVGTAAGGAGLVQADLHLDGDDLGEV